MPDKVDLNPPPIEFLLLASIRPSARLSMLIEVPCPHDIPPRRSGCKRGTSDVQETVRSKSETMVGLRRTMVVLRRRVRCRVDPFSFGGDGHLPELLPMQTQHMGWEAQAARRHDRDFHRRLRQLGPAPFRINSVIAPTTNASLRPRRAPTAAAATVTASCCETSSALKLPARGEAQFGEDLAEVPFNRAWADEQARGNVVVGQVFAH
jgi:hypothetical protein